MSISLAALLRIRCMLIGLFSTFRGGSLTSWSTSKTACERRGHAHLILAQFVFLPVPVHQLGCQSPACCSLSCPPEKCLHLVICIPASRRESTRLSFPPLARSARHVASSPPPSLRPATPPAFAFQHVSRRAHHTNTRSGVLPAFRRRSSRLPHPLCAFRVSSRSIAHA